VRWCEPLSNSLGEALRYKHASRMVSMAALFCALSACKAKSAKDTPRATPTVAPANGQVTDSSAAHDRSSANAHRRNVAHGRPGPGSGQRYPAILQRKLDSAGVGLSNRERGLQWRDVGRRTATDRVAAARHRRAS
jgi:hypothetical protein